MHLTRELSVDPPNTPHEDIPNSSNNAANKGKTRKNCKKCACYKAVLEALDKELLSKTKL